MPGPSDFSPTLSRELTWPDEVPPLGHPEFEPRLGKWLLGLLPAALAAQPVARRHLDVLLHLAAAVLAGSLDGLRQAYATARAELGAGHPPETVAASMRAIAEVGRRLHEQLAFVEFVRAQRVD